MKKIALIMDGWMRYFTFAWPSGILARIKELNLDANLYIFNSNGNWSGDDEYNRGEYNIFNLPNLNDFDGIILDINNIKLDGIRENIIEKVKATNLPTIAIGNEFENFYYVGINNYEAMTHMLEHVYSHHNSHSYWFIIGPDDNYENSQRYLSICDFIKKYDIK